LRNAKIYLFNKENNRPSSPFDHNTEIRRLSCGLLKTGHLGRVDAELLDAARQRTSKPSTRTSGLQPRLLPFFIDKPLPSK
jgi:ribosomal protein L16/L10AE